MNPPFPQRRNRTDCGFRSAISLIPDSFAWEGDRSLTVTNPLPSTHQAHVTGVTANQMLFRWGYKESLILIREDIISRRKTM
ncbi:hypothetical protein TNCV_2601801 [Trichonephila clavipes]|nr:hypothetical protein TNCV_2601801 [Trichonephila clavipes]